MHRNIALSIVMTTLFLAACGLPGASSNEEAQLVSAEKTLAALEQQAANAQQAPPTESPATVEVEGPEPDTSAPEPVPPTVTPTIEDLPLQARSGDPLILINLDDGSLVQDNGCNTIKQDMTFYGTGIWLFDDHLFGRGLNCDLSFDIGVEKSGRYEIKLTATYAPDFGLLSVTLVRGSNMDHIFNIELYNPEVKPTAVLPLGEWPLTAGEKTELAFVVIDKNPASSDYAFGLDFVELEPITRAP